jgi:hypothetical protein
MLIPIWDKAHEASTLMQTFLSERLRAALNREGQPLLAGPLDTSVKLIPSN